jgi:cell wall-associated NlpC family hydrolase
LFASGTEVGFSQLRPGDLLFYRFEDDVGPPSHVMIYLGDGEAIHAPAGGKVVQTAKVSSKAFSKRFMGARRLLN